jgi:hypothetical protein
VEAARSAREEIQSNIPAENREKFYLRRSLVGGTLCDIDDPEECDYFVDEMIHGAGVMDSLNL